MELDFSDFNTPGDYFISIPGVGRSWEFKLAPTAFDRAFYVQMRGLFHQRSGIEKSAALTGWPMPAGRKAPGAAASRRTTSTTTPKAAASAIPPERRSRSAPSI